MIIQSGKKMLLFRYSNYRKTNFISEHSNIIDSEGYTWMLKAGKKSDLKKVKAIIEDGGAIILKSPVSDGDKYYMGIFDSVTNEEPDDAAYPEYYDDFMDDNFDFDGGQWFRIVKLQPFQEKYIDKLCLQKDEKLLIDVLGTTRTAVMFIKSLEDMEI